MDPSIAHIIELVKGDEAMAEFLLQEPGLDVNLTSTGTRWTALHWACQKGQTWIVRRLLAHPSLTCHNAVDSAGRSPLMNAVWWNRVECVRELVAVEGVDLETRDSRGRGLEEMARIEGCLEAWQVVREELRRREEWRRRPKTEESRILSVEEMMAKCRGVLKKNPKQKKMILKKAKTKEAREKRRRAAEANMAKVESLQEELMVELGKLKALMEEDSAQDRREEIESPVCLEEMAPPRTIFQCSQGHPVCSSCMPRLVHCPSCREAFMAQ